MNKKPIAKSHAVRLGVAAASIVLLASHRAKQTPRQMAEWYVQSLDGLLSGQLTLPQVAEAFRLATASSKKGGAR